MTRLLLCVLVPLQLLVRLTAPVGRRARRLRRTAEAGMTTAEYAVGTVAAVAFAVVLYKVVRSPAVSSALSGIIASALHAL